MSMITGRILDRADRAGSWFPVVAGFLIAFLPQVLAGHGWAWPLFAAGLVMTAVHPAGTSLRRRLLAREVRRMLDGRRGYR